MSFVFVILCQSLALPWPESLPSIEKIHSQMWTEMQETLPIEAKAYKVDYLNESTAVFFNKKGQRVLTQSVVRQLDEELGYRHLELEQYKKSSKPRFQIIQSTWGHNLSLPSAEEMHLVLFPSFELLPGETETELEIFFEGRSDFYITLQQIEDEDVLIRYAQYRTGTSQDNRLIIRELYQDGFASIQYYFPWAKAAGREELTLEIQQEQEASSEFASYYYRLNHEPVSAAGFYKMLKAFLDREFLQKARSAFSKYAKPE